MSTQYETEMALRQELREAKMVCEEALTDLARVNTTKITMSQTIEALRERVREVEQEKREAIKYTEMLYNQDIERMNSILNEAAENADLCDQYEAALERVNQSCTLIELMGRPKDWEVFVQLQVTVSAVTEDEADNIAESIASNFNGDMLSVGYDDYHVYADAETSRTRRAD